MKLKTKHLFIILFSCLSFAAFAQEEVENDFGVRAAVKLDTDILSKKLNLSLKEELRFNENVSVLSKFNSTLGLKYKVKKWIRFGGHYRFSLNKKNNGSYGQRHRFMGDMTLRAYPQQFKLSYRARIQKEIRGHNYKKINDIPASTTDFRNTFTVAYAVNKTYQPYASFDLRYRIKDTKNPEISDFDRYKITAGVDMRLAKRRDLSVYFMTSRRWHKLVPSQLYVVGIQFSLSNKGILF